MENSKVFVILSTFDKYEQNRLQKYLRSPYFNRNEGLIRLFELLAEVINEEAPSSQLEKSYLWEEINGGDYDDTRFRKYCSDLLRLVEGFMAQERYNDNPLHQANHLLESIRERKITKLNKGAMKSARRLANRQPHRSATYYYYHYQIEKNFYELSRLERKKKNPITNVEEVAGFLDKFYLAEKLRYMCEVLTHQYAVSHEYKILFKKEILDHVEEYDYNSIPPVAIYYQIYLALMDTEEEDHYFRLKDLLNQYGLEFAQNEAFEIYSYAINYCTRKINKGNQDFLREYFDLYNDLLNKSILIVNGEIPLVHFNNMAIVGLRLGEIKWTEKFIKKFNSYLPERQRENAVTFNLARLYFYRKDFEKVVEKLQFVEYEDVIYNINSKSLLLMTYYELDEIEPLYSLMDSFRAYLNRHKNIPARRRRTFLNLIRYVKKLNRVRPGDKKSIEQLKEEIETSREIASVQWLLEKVGEMV